MIELHDVPLSRRMKTHVAMSNTLFTQMNPPQMDDEIQRQIFDVLFGRFRNAVFRKIPHSADLNKNSEIVASVFSELLRTVNGDFKTSDNGMFAKDFEIAAQTLLPGFTSDELQKLFTYFDGDHDGKISVEEFVFGIKVQYMTVQGTF